MFDPQLTDVLEAIRTCVPPPGTATRIVAIDGHGGSGKSSLARLLARELNAQIVQTDDFASWENPTDWWPELLELVLVPLAAGAPARYRPTSWGGPEREPVVVEPCNLVLLEGVTASRERFRPYLAYAIWVETPRELCLRRGLERDGEEMLDQWLGWLGSEDAYIDQERPQDHVDVVLSGNGDLWT